MQTPALLAAAQGEWVGPSRLNLSWLPDPIFTCESRLSIGIQGHFATLHYLWEQDGKPESGFLVVTEGEQAVGGWTDSWHQPTVMSLRGTGGNPIDFKGEYAVEGHPNWGWRITLASPSPDTFELRMFNISPQGEEEWAVEAIYQRAT